MTHDEIYKLCAAVMAFIGTPASILLSGLVRNYLASKRHKSRERERLERESEKFYPRGNIKPNGHPGNGNDEDINRSEDTDPPDNHPPRRRVRGS